MEKLAARNKKIEKIHLDIEKFSTLMNLLLEMVDKFICNDVIFNAKGFNWLKNDFIKTSSSDNYKKIIASSFDVNKN